MTSTTRTAPSTTRSTTRSAAAAVLVTGALLLAGCGASAEAAHNDADVTFASGMVVHHEGALAMAQDAQQRAASPEVKALADRVVAAQEPEIDQMEGFLASWGEEGDDGDHGGDHGGHGTAGTGEDDVAALEAASGTAYDRLFLEQMTAHHRDAVEMAQQEQAGGVAPEAVALAEQIEADQTAEIDEMAGLLAQLPS